MTDDERGNRYEDAAAAIGAARQELKRALTLLPTKGITSDDVNDLIKQANGVQQRILNFAKASRKG